MLGLFFLDNNDLAWSKKVLNKKTIGLKPRISRASIAPTLRSGQLKNSQLPGFSPKITVLRLGS
jgi:hypothetical protein